MKIYRQSFWKSHETKGWIVPFTLLLIGMPFLIYYLKVVNPNGNLKLGLYLWGGVVLFWSMVFSTGYCYVIVSTRQLIIKNPYFPFRSHYNREYFFSDIEKIWIGSPGGLSPIHMLVFVSGKRRKRFPIGLVSPKEYHNLRKDLEEKGVKVEIVVHESFLK